MRLTLVAIDSWLAQVLTEQVFPKEVDRHSHLKSDAKVKVDPEYLRRAVINIIDNAVHALQEDGAFSNQIHIGTQGDGKRLEIRVFDTGPGIPDHILAKVFEPLFSTKNFGVGLGMPIVKDIFEPYFTTKGIGKGSGMGLALVHGIVQSCGGFIEIESEPGKGSIFYVYFPAIAEKIPEIIGDQKGESLPQGREQILAVDDEKSIVALYQAALKRIGYKVAAHCSSEKALDAFLASPDSFDLVITDQTMPHLTGSEPAQRILEIRPDIPIILCTGYSSILSPEEVKKVGIERFLSDSKI
jgi:CheY-like chemotaxis protein